MKLNAVQVRNRAINALDSWVETHPAKKVVLLAKKYSISSWLKGAYLRLVQQKTLTTQELLSPPSLDWETIGRLLVTISSNPLLSLRTYTTGIDRNCHFHFARNSSPCTAYLVRLQSRMSSCAKPRVATSTSSVVVTNLR
jgi:hypothetical protein